MVCGPVHKVEVSAAAAGTDLASCRGDQRSSGRAADASRDGHVAGRVARVRARVKILLVVAVRGV